MARTNTATNTNTANASSELTQAEFVRQYMESLGTQRKSKLGISERLALFAEDKAVSMVRNSKRTWGRISAAWEIADDIAQAAYAEEHARHAQRMAERLGYK